MNNKQKEPENHYKALLDKYVSVWLWSIHFGAISGVGISFISYRPLDTRWSAFAAMSALLTGIGVVAGISSLVALYQGLVRYLIPQFILNEPSNAWIFARSLRTSLIMLIIASLARGFRIIVEILIPALSGISF